MICDNCIHQKACINAYASMGYFIDETKENEYKHTILKCKEFEDKEKYQAAVKKQIPQKPQYSGNDEQDTVYCPSCGFTFGFCDEVHYFSINPSYCEECGQALDWSE